MVHVPIMFLSEWREFSSAPCLEKIFFLKARLSIMLKLWASPDMPPFAYVTRKDLQFST
jgi:hypothetical protein